MKLLTGGFRRLRTSCSLRVRPLFLGRTRLFTFSIIAAVTGSAIWFVMQPRLFSQVPMSHVTYDRFGKLLGATVARDGQWRFPATDSIPYKFTQSITCFEDKRFFHHAGIDPFALCRAIKNNIIQKQVQSGGSTITMQVIRLARRNPHRTLPEKCIEALSALRLELHMSKAAILQLYAAHAPFGGNVVGLEAASWRYFGCAPQSLSWAECATLAVLPNSPSLVYPGKNRSRLIAKRNRLIYKLYHEGSIDSTTAVLATCETIPGKPFPLPRTAPHLLDRSIREAQSVAHTPFKNKGIHPSQTRTTIDGSLQVRVADITMQHQARLAGNGVFNIAALVIDNSTGAVLAYIGNTHAFGSTHGYAVDIITAPRSTGSILKPFLYAGMLESGELLPTRLVVDLPIRLGGFAPQNFNRSFDGAVAAHEALARSLNVPAVSMLHEYGIDRFYALCKDFGLRTLFRKAEDYGLSLILGGAEGTLWDIASAYSHMAYALSASVVPDSRSPSRIPSIHFRATQTAADTLSSVAMPVSPGSIWLTFQAMEEVIRPEEQSVWEQFSSAKRIAWKTGTSFGFRDAWAIGITPSYTVGVWVGNASGEGRPLLTGSTAAAPVMFDILALFKTEPWFTCPEFDLAPVTICAKSGYSASVNCAATKQIRSSRAGSRSAACPYCSIIHCDSTLTWRVHSDCEPVYSGRSISWFVLPPSIEWLYRKKHSDYRPLPPWRSDCAANAPGGTTGALSIIIPYENSLMYIPVELDGKKGRTVFEAAHRSAHAVLYWHIDDEYIGSTQKIHQLPCAPKPGRHVLTVVDEQGERVRRQFTIVGN